MSSDDELIEAMWRAYIGGRRFSMPNGIPTAMRAVLAVVRAHDRDGEIGRLARRKLASGNGVPVERCHITAKEVAAIDAAMRAER